MMARGLIVMLSCGILSSPMAGSSPDDCGRTRIRSSCSNGTCTTLANTVVTDSYVHADKIVIPLFRFQYLEPQDDYGGTTGGDTTQDREIVIDDKTMDAIVDRVIQRLQERGLLQPGKAGGSDEVDPNPVNPQAHKKPPEAPEWVFLKNNCSTCHSGGAAKGGLAMFDGQGRSNKLSREQWVEISDRISRQPDEPGRMPPGSRQSATRADRAAVQKKTRK